MRPAWPLASPARNAGGMSEESKPKSAQRATRRRTVRRLVGDAERRSGGAGVFLGDTTRVAGVEVVELDDEQPSGKFEGR